MNGGGGGGFFCELLILSLARCRIRSERQTVDFIVGFRQAFIVGPLWVRSIGNEVIWDQTT